MLPIPSRRDLIAWLSALTLVSRVATGQVLMPPTNLPLSNFTPGFFLGEIDGVPGVDLLLTPGFTLYRNIPLSGPLPAPTALAPPISAAPGFFALGAQDYDGDGIIDLLVSEQSLLTSPSTVRLLFMRGTGTAAGFAPAQQIMARIAFQYQSALTADLDGNGERDLVVSIDPPVAATEIWLQTGGVFSLALSEPGTTRFLRAGDFDGDGRDEVFFIISAGQGRVADWTPSAGVTASTVSVPSPSTVVETAWISEASDRDGDGDADLIFAAWRALGVAAPLPAVIQVLSGDPNLGLVPGANLPASGLLDVVRDVRDVDGDGIDDLFGSDSVTPGSSSDIRFAMIRGDGPASFVGPKALISGQVASGGSAPLPSPLADLDGDGDQDILDLTTQNFSPFLRRMENLARYGAPCPGQLGAPTLDTSPATPGSLFTVTLDNAAPLCPATLVISLGSTISSMGPAPACGLLIDLNPSLLITPPGSPLTATTSSVGTATWTFALPPTTVPLGPFFLQAGCQDPAGSLTLGGVTYSATDARALSIF